MDQKNSGTPEEDSPLKIAYVGFILFVALGLVLNMILNDSSSEEKRDLKKDNTEFKVANDGGVLKTMDQDEDGNISLKLSKKIKVSEDTFIFRFSFNED